ncbi:MAG: NCS2 family permease, partial [Oligoflexales bacterium]|nr:NCS2 family permease [Oligoflexales bacterium]
MLEKLFRLKENKTDVRTEIIAGLTTFMTMSYILIVNPIILSKTGMDSRALITATAISTCFATLLMALMANLPIAAAPGMGLNAFFAYTVVLGLGYSWRMALTAVFIEGLIFIFITIFNIREAIVDSIPKNIKIAISSGIGLFIAFIGLVNAGLVKTGLSIVGPGKLDGVIVKLGNIKDPSVIIAIIGIIAIGVMLSKNIKGALLYGIVISTLIGIPLGVTKLPETFKLVSLPPSIEPIFFKLDFSKVLTKEMAVILFTFLFTNIFDTIGTL